MFKKILFIGSVALILSGCSKNIDVQNSGGLILSGDNQESMEIPNDNKQSNNLTPDIIEELNTLYNTKLVFQKVNRLENFIIADANDGTEQPDNGILIVVAKINNKWIKLYEGNSGEISCSLIEKYNFPKELLENCTPGADYTIPQEALPFANK